MIAIILSVGSNRYNPVEVTFSQALTIHLLATLPALLGVTALFLVWKVGSLNAGAKISLLSLIIMGASILSGTWAMGEYGSAAPSLPSDSWVGG